MNRNYDEEVSYTLNYPEMSNPEHAWDPSTPFTALLASLKKLSLHWARRDLGRGVCSRHFLPHLNTAAQQLLRKLLVNRTTVQAKGTAILREKIQKAINNYMPEGTIPVWFNHLDLSSTSRLRVRWGLTPRLLAIIKANYRRDRPDNIFYETIGALRPDGSRITLDDKEKFLENIIAIYNNAAEKEAANKITKAAHKKLARMAEPGGSSYLDAMQQFRYRQHQQRKEMVKKKQKKRKNKKKRIVDVSPRIVLHEYPYHNVNSAPSVGLVNWNPRAVPGKAHIGGKIRKNKKKGGSKCGCRTRKGGFFGRFKKKVNTKKKGYSGGKRSAGRRKTHKRSRSGKRRKTRLR